MANILKPFLSFKGDFLCDESTSAFRDDCHSSGTSFSTDLEASIDLSGDDILLLTESDVPGSSLSGKDPAELNVVQLKRWLACRGAPITGKKPQLIER